MRTVKKVIVEDAKRRDTSVVPPLHEIMTVAAMFLAVIAVFVR